MTGTSWKLLLSCAVAAPVLLAGCEKDTAPKSASTPVVTVARPATQTLADYIDLTGTVSAYQSADLVARVEGYLEKIDFVDGAFVDEGKLLFNIEQDTYQEKLKLHEAQLTRAQQEYERQRTLYKKDAASKANMEEWLSRRAFAFDPS